MLHSANLIAFVATTDPGRARAFYERVLGLALVAEEAFALVFDAHGIMLRVQNVHALAPPPYTILGWDVPDLAAEIEQLTRQGVVFERYEGLGQDERGICTFPDGTQVAWFKDPDGNILSLTQFN